VARDRIAELLLIKQRAGKYKRVSAKIQLGKLTRAWDKELRGADPADELIPIRLVTIIEVFLKDWIEALIDHGAPYVERASKLKLDLKYDFAIARSLEGGSVTLGELVAHSIPLSGVESFSAVLGILLDEDFFQLLSKTRDAWKVKLEGDSVGPIISDIASLRRTLAKLFEVRHILVHELPDKKPHKLDEVSDFLSAAALFIDASEEEFWSRIHPGPPRTQTEMNRDAAARREAAVQELEVLCNQIKGETGRDEIESVQRLWLNFKEAEAERQTERHLGGSIRPMIYSLAAEAITRSRIDELKNWLRTRI
jgi:Lysozyme inhibitor LprI